MISKKIFIFFLSILILIWCADNKNQMTNPSSVNWLAKDIESVEKIESRVKDFPPADTITHSQKISEWNVTITEWISGLDVPWELAFIDDETALVTERSGTIRKIVNWELQSTPFWEAPSLERGEWWLMWLALHPDYENNGYIYVMYTYRKENGMDIANKVVRLLESDTWVTIDTTIVDDIPAKLYHNWGRIHFWPDEKLYISTWDASNPQIAQDLGSLGGKILRVNDDGTIPDDNPFENSLIFSYGHRNPQWITWNESNDLFISGHGPSWEFGLRAKDRVDSITPWTNYWWPEAYGPDQWYPNPLAYWPDSATPPWGMAFWNGSLFVATLLSASLIQLDIEKTDTWYMLTNENRWFEWTYGRLRDVTVWADGNLYLLTSNGDGRNWWIDWDDIILKIEKK